MTEAERLAEAMAEIERLRAEIVRLQAAHAVTRGTLEQPPAEDAPTTITHGHAPSAPPHIGHTIKWPIRTGDNDE